MPPATISVVITGAPSNFRKPKTLPGESSEQFTIRTNPEHWRNCIASMEGEFSLTKETCNRLRQGDIDKHEFRVRSQIHEFMRWRWPQTGRTLDSMAKVRQALTQPALCNIVEIQTRIVQIVLPAAHRDESYDQQLPLLCKEYGAEIIWLNLEDWGSFFVQKVLPKVNGEFVWMVPALTRCHGPMTALLVTQIIKIFSNVPTLAMFTDNEYTEVFRVEVIRDLLRRGLEWPNETRQKAKMLQECGYRWDLQEVDLVELEELYGGNPKVADANSESRANKPEKRPWWKGLFGA